jgi:hypothetical protein
MSLHLVICDNTEDPLEPTVCPTCEGEQVIYDYSYILACPDCCCEVCGRPTSTPPLCAECDKEQTDGS